MARILSLKSTYKLNSGFEIPLLGFGTSSVVQQAIAYGYRAVDAAAFYQNEAACADGLLKSGVPREQFFYTSKVPPNMVSYEGAKAAISQSFNEVLDLKYIDLMLLHAPWGGSEGRFGAWKALVEAGEVGTVRSIGVSNWGVAHLAQLEQHITEIDSQQGKGGVLSVNQIELHPWLPHRDIVEWCKKHGVIVQAWAPLAQATRWGDKTIQSIAHRTGKTEAQILLRWSLQKGFNPLPKSVTASRIAENINIFDFTLSEAEMAALETDEYDFHGWE
ncbi:uncharacterized protein A1O9_11590 [Exophiala aquamarina CBS 119918]|uniref:D-xylose reductase [NAD(P)H] n=1 Tax=Exophiala aquamarina CBS 119918 TaxID=1182545 RepID=A0A072P9Y3_9EURO|nr:uncharacterized protein A1O9_11590 [Exophiala aquamarina CBS 119918]KEF52350.1 hypothetical protein A1O9_11590 [Exophiala aquamarina CBS 119918]